MTDKLWAKLDAAERRVKAPHRDETFIGYTRPVPIPGIVAEESGQAPYGKLDGAEFHEAILQIRGLWANLTTDQRADVAHAALHAALSRIESYGQSRKKHNS